VDYNPGIGPFLYSPSINLATPILYSNPSTTCYKTSVNVYSKICDTPTTDTIDYTKTIFGGEGLITMNFTNYSDLEHYKNNWDYFYTNFAGSPANPLDVDYYRYFILSIPLATGSQQCGDLVGYQDYFIHPSAVVTTGGTGPWSMSITMPTISNGLTWDSCDVNCSAYTIDIVNEINVSSTSLGNAISITTNTGSKLEYPFWSRKFLNSGDTSFSSVTYNRTLSIPKYVNETIPYSGSPLTIIPSLSAQTCDLSSYFWSNSGSTTNLSNYVKNYYYYNFRVISNSGDFEIWSYDVANNPLFVPPLIKIYENIGGVPNIIDPSYFV
jgi:hypothetical protein